MIFMSSTIEFKRNVYHIGKNKHNSDIYMAINLVGDTNVFDMNDNISKEWNLVKIGEKHSIIGEVAHISSSTSGGMLRYQNGSTKPENYIKNWRRNLKNPKPIEQFFKRFIRKEGIVEFENGMELKDRDKETIEELKENEDFKEEITEKYGTEKRVFTIELKSVDDIKKWKNLYFTKKGDSNIQKYMYLDKI